MGRIAPAPLPWGASEDEAVELCRQWMVFLGALDTVASSGGVRKVCDLYNSGFLAWVMYGPRNLSVAEVERVASAAAMDGRYPLVFVPGGVLPSAQDRADQLGVALLRFDARSADLDGANSVGRRLLASGLALD